MARELTNKRVIVMGLGRFGGGIGVTRWLCGQGARVLVSDRATSKDLEDSLAQLHDLDIELHLGSHQQTDLDRCDLLVVSPAIDKQTSDFFQEAHRRGIPWTSEMNLFLDRCAGRIVGVTGSLGKSTTTAMITAALRAGSGASGWRHGRVWLGGNIGHSLLHDLNSMTPDDVVVLEMSSFQLEDAGSLQKSPSIALVTNFREHHLDRHGTMQAYAQAKGMIYRFQARHHWMAMPFGDGVECLPGGWEDRPRLYRFGVDEGSGQIRLHCRNNADLGTDVIPIRLRVPGLHNVHNAAGALSVTRMLGVADAVSLPALAGFEGLAHRLEFVRDYQGVCYYNDSKATSPQAAMASIRSFDKPVVLICGGADQGDSFKGLAEVVAGGTKAVICVGQSCRKIAQEIEQAKDGATSPVINESGTDLARGILTARSAAKHGDVVLLSPACASYDAFHNYEERGDVFKKIVLNWD